MALYLVQLPLPKYRNATTDRDAGHARISGCKIQFVIRKQSTQSSPGLGIALHRSSQQLAAARSFPPMTRAAQRR